MYNSINENPSPGKEDALQLMKLIDALLRSAESVPYSAEKINEKT